MPPLAAALFVTVGRLPPSRTEWRGRIDWPGTGLVLGATALVCTALVQADTWVPACTWTVLALGGLLGAATVWHVRRHRDPIVQPRLLTVRRLRLGVTGIFAYYGVSSARGSP